MDSLFYQLSKDALSGLSKSELKVYTIMYDQFKMFTKNGNEYFRSYNDLANDCKLCTRQVKRIMKSLIEKGLIEVTHKGNNLVKKANRYVVKTKGSDKNVTNGSDIDSAKNVTRGSDIEVRDGDKNVTRGSDKNVTLTKINKSKNLLKENKNITYTSNNLKESETLTNLADATKKFESGVNEEYHSECKTERNKEKTDIEIMKTETSNTHKDQEPKTNKQSLQPSDNVKDLDKETLTSMVLDLTNQLATLTERLDKAGRYISRLEKELKESVNQINVRLDSISNTATSNKPSLQSEDTRNIDYREFEDYAEVKDSLRYCDEESEKYNFEDVSEHKEDNKDKENNITSTSVKTQEHNNSSTLSEDKNLHNNQDVEGNHNSQLTSTLPCESKEKKILAKRKESSETFNNYNAQVEYFISINASETTIDVLINDIEDDNRLNDQEKDELLDMLNNYKYKYAV